MRILLVFIFPLLFLTTGDTLNWKRNMSLNESDFYLLNSFELKGKVKSVKNYTRIFKNEEKNLDGIDPVNINKNLKVDLHDQLFFDTRKLLTSKINYLVGTNQIFSEHHFAYDKNLNIINIEEKKGFGIRYKYDSQNRRIEKKLYATDKEVIEITSFLYDVEDTLSVLKDMKSLARDHYVNFVHYNEDNQQVDTKKYLLETTARYVGEESIKYNKDGYFLETLVHGSKADNHYIVKYKYTYDDQNTITNYLHDDYEICKNIYLFDKQGNWILKIKGSDINNYVYVYKREITYYP